MSLLAMMMVRERVQSLVPHLRVECVPNEYAATMHRFAAGYDMPMDDLHMALWGIETAAYFVSDQALAVRASNAASYCLPLCATAYQASVKRSICSQIPKGICVERAPVDRDCLDIVLL